MTGVNDLKFASHDTDVVWNLAVLANELKRKDDALIYYKKIADAGLSEEKYAAAYDALILNYKKEKNAELFAKYITAAKKYYPIDIPYWENQEIEFAIKDLQGEALLSKYEELSKTIPNNYVLFYNYAIEIDKYIGDSTGKRAEDYKSKMIELFKRAVTIKSTVEGNLQLANMFYSKTYELQEQAAKIKGTKLIIVMGHNKCGAVKGAIDDAELGNLTQLVAQIKPAIVGDTTNMENMLNETSKQNVKMTIADILKLSPVISELVKENKVKIAGAFYDITTGKVIFLD